MALNADTKKKLLAVGLFVTLGGVLYYQFFVAGSAPAAQPQRAGGRPTPSPLVSRTGLNADGKIEVVTQPLPLNLLAVRGTAEGGTGRNIFVYPTPTPTPTPVPTPTPPPPPPPPITLSGLNPSGVIARTGEFSMTIIGAKIPRDGVVYINGRNYPTTFINETQIRAVVPRDAIAAPGNLRVEVKSQSDAQIFSNPLNLNVAAPPTPPYAYVAQIVDPKGVEIAVLKSQADGRLISLKQGEKIDNWKLVSIATQKIEMLDTNYNIQHSVNFTAESSQ